MGLSPEERKKILSFLKKISSGTRPSLQDIRISLLRMAGKITGFVEKVEKESAGKFTGT